MSAELYQVFIKTATDLKINQFVINDLNFFEFGNILIMQYRPSFFIRDLNNPDIQSLIQEKSVRLLRFNSSFFKRLLPIFLNRPNIECLSIESKDGVKDDILNSEILDIIRGVEKLPLQNVEEPFDIQELFLQSSDLDLTINAWGVITINFNMIGTENVRYVLDILNEVVHE